MKILMNDYTPKQISKNDIVVDCYYDRHQKLYAICLKDINTGDYISDYEYAMDKKEAQFIKGLMEKDPKNWLYDSYELLESLNEDNNYGYHAGDLGKSEQRERQTGGRGTGHFGTGTYFVGNPDKIKGYNDFQYGKGEAPHHIVDFSSYNLYKPSNNFYGYKLHDTLKELNNGYKYYSKYGNDYEWFMSKNLTASDSGNFEVRDIPEIVSHLNNLLSYNLIELPKDIDWNTIEDEYEKEDDRLYNELKDKYKDEDGHTNYSKLFDAVEDELDKNPKFKEKNEIIGEIRRGIESELRSSDLDNYKRFKKLQDRLSDALEHRHSKEEIANALNEVNEHLDDKTGDSLSTIFMKALGYDGVDVRHLNKDSDGWAGLDNTTYGSVIYDVKPETIVEDMLVEMPKFANLKKLPNNEWLYKENVKIGYNSVGKYYFVIEPDSLNWMYANTLSDLIKGIKRELNEHLGSNVKLNESTLYRGVGKVTGIPNYLNKYTGTFYANDKHNAAMYGDVSSKNIDLSNMKIYETRTSSDAISELSLGNYKSDNLRRFIDNYISDCKEDYDSAFYLFDEREYGDYVIDRLNVYYDIYEDYFGEAYDDDPEMYSFQEWVQQIVLKDYLSSRGYDGIHYSEEDGFSQYQLWNEKLIKESLNEYMDKVDTRGYDYRGKIEITITDEIYSVIKKMNREEYRICYYAPDDIIGMVNINAGIHEDITDYCSNFNYYSRCDEYRLLNFLKSNYSEPKEIEIDYPEYTCYELEDYYLFVVKDEAISGTPKKFEKTSFYALLESDIIHKFKRDYFGNIKESLDTFTFPNLRQAIDYYWKDRNANVEKVSIQQLVDDNNLLDDDDLQSYHQRQWDNKKAKEFSIDKSKVNSMRLSEVPYAVRHKDGKLELGDGRHRTRALYNDGYKFVEIPVLTEKEIFNNSNDTITINEEKTQNSGNFNIQNVFHGGPHTTLHPNFKSTLWFSEDFDYALDFGENIFICNLYIENVLDVGNTDGYIRGLIPTQFNLDFTNLAHKLNLEPKDLLKIDRDAKNIYTIVRTKEFKDLCIKNGYDGIKTIEEGNVCYGVFDLSQVEIVDTDFEDEEENLLVANGTNKFNETLVYHGTDNDFNDFEDGRINWFTTDENYAKQYGQKILKRDIDTSDFINIGEINQYLDYVDDDDYDKDGKLIVDYSNTFVPKCLKELADKIGVDVDELISIYNMEHLSEYEDDDGITFLANSLYDITNSLYFYNLLKENNIKGIIASEGGITTYGVVDKNAIRSLNEDLENNHTIEDRGDYILHTFKGEYSDQYVEEYKTLKGIMSQVMDNFINNKDYMTDDMTLYIEYKDGSTYYLGGSFDNDKFKKTGIKNIIIDDGTYAVYGDWIPRMEGGALYIETPLTNKGNEQINEALTTDNYYRYEILKDGKLVGGLFKGYVDIMNDLKEFLPSYTALFDNIGKEIPKPDVNYNGYGSDLNRCAFTEYGVKKFENALKTIKDEFTKNNIKLVKKKVNPDEDAIIYGDDYQIVYYDDMANVEPLD